MRPPASAGHCPQADGGRLRDMSTVHPRWPRRLLLWPLAGALGLGALVAGLGLAAIEGQPSTPAAPVVSEADITRAMLLMQAHDPRGQLPGITRLLALNERDLALLMAQVGRRLGPAHTRARLHAGSARLQASLALPPNPFGAWLNLELRLSQRPTGVPDIDRLRLGHLSLPGWLVAPALAPVVAVLGLRAQSHAALKVISHVALAPGALMLAYAWPDDLQATLTGGLLAPAEQARVAVYAARLTSLMVDLAQELTDTGSTHTSAAFGAMPAVSMAKLLPPLFALARQRSSDRASAVLENRAALMALAFLVDGHGLSGHRPTARLASGQAGGQRNTPGPAASVTLLGRVDTPQHFLVSAALSAQGGAALADAVGLYKELSDSKGGSGFSFNDLAADRAGVRFGQFSERDPIGFQTRLAAGVGEGELMPIVADLPEELTRQEFQRRFGGVGGRIYQQMLSDIEARLDRLALLAVAR